MQLYYYKSTPSFGDTFNPWFWLQFIYRPFVAASDELFAGVGTLLNNQVPMVFGKFTLSGQVLDMVITCPARSATGLCIVCKSH